MLYLIPILCLGVCTFFVARFFAVKTRLVEKTIEETIARKLAAASPKVEIVRLKEENGVMKNLLRDMVENEASSPGAMVKPTVEERDRIARIKALRRREIFGEAIYVLQQSEKAEDAALSFKIHG
jgi:hypothetical protein